MEATWPSVAPALLEDEGLGWPAATFLSAMTGQLQLIDDWVRDTAAGVGWSSFLDPALCPAEALPWLGQFVGVVVPPGTATATARTLVAAEAGFKRGTPGAMASVGKLTLTGLKRMVITERNGTPFALGVRTITSETPDPVATLAALMSQKPAGLLLTLTTSVGITWQDATNTWNTAAPAGVTWTSVDANPTTV